MAGPAFTRSQFYTKPKSSRLGSPSTAKIRLAKALRGATISITKSKPPKKLKAYNK